MPKIFEYFGFVFLFYSSEHTPIHVHVTHSNCGTIFELIVENGELVEIRERPQPNTDPLPAKDNRIAREFIQKYHKNIIDKWIKFFVYKMRIRSTVINKKL